MSAPLIKYKTGYNATQIDEVECSRESAASVWIMRGRKGYEVERRDSRMSEYTQYHDSWELAHAYLVKRAESNVAACRMKLETLKGTLGNVKGMKPPAGAK